MGKVFSITSGLENLGALKTGGQGSVYKAKRIGEIITAVKILPTPIYSESNDDKHFTDFQNEVEKLKKVNREPNPHVVKIINSGLTESGNLPFIEMEFIEGPDMEDLLKPPNDPVFSVKEVIKVADQLSYGLAHCHKVEVKHGDIKSNNVKFNVNTGNYILLDFGLAIMSEEQRRTSMRQAGAIEFMAPEQNDGQMLFQTDVYSYGIILFELLSGTVPFPLSDRGETARNKVMIAHMEQPVPNILSGRKQMLPANWDEVKKEREMKVPQWLLNTVYKCLQKDPDNRFKNGMELHEYIVLYSTLAESKVVGSSVNTALLEKENERLRTLLMQYRELAKSRNSYPQVPHKILSLNDVLPTAVIAEPAAETGTKKRSSDKRTIAAALIFLMILCGAAGVIYQYRKKIFKHFVATQPVDSNIVATSLLVAPKTIQYKVSSPKAFFYNAPDENTKRWAYMVPDDAMLTALKEANDFVYVEFMNKRNQLSKGWLRKNDLITIDKFSNSPNISPTPVNFINNNVDSDLKKASALLSGNHTEEALKLYNTLAKQGVPEAMFQFGNLALKGINDNIDCTEAIQWINKAANKNYQSAKTVLGFLYMFAENEAMMAAKNYMPCNLKQDTVKGARLLKESLMQGDTTAAQYLEQNKNEPDYQ